MKLTKTYIEGIIKGCKNRKHIIKKLKTSKVKFTDESDFSGYDNIKIPTGGRNKETIRIYKDFNTNKYVVQVIHLVRTTYSGIPTFFGSDLFSKVKA